MIGEVLRMTSAWLQHPTHGLNAMMALVPRESGDPLPDPVLAFLTEVDDEDGALGRYATTPTLHVMMTCESAQQNSDQVAVNVGDGTVVVNIRLAEAASRDAKAMKRDTTYRLRALVWSVRRWMQQPLDASRVRNAVAILEFGPLEFNALYETIDDTIVTGGARLVCTTRDVGLA